MDFLKLPLKTAYPPAAGMLLIAEPFLSEPAFARTVILLCVCDKEGAFGLVLNRPSAYLLTDLLTSAFPCSLPVYIGGPVQPESLHMLHCVPELLGGTEVWNGVYLGGDYEQAQELLYHDQHPNPVARFFSGYAGWSPGQLEQELEQKSWLVAPASLPLLFNIPAHEVWKHAVVSLGSPFSSLVHYPLCPQLN